MSNKLERRGMSLVDVLMVTQTLDQGEIDQIIAFGGNPDPEVMAKSLFGCTPLCWTVAEVETGEPLVIGGFIQTGAVMFRSFFLANPRVFEEFGAEITKITADTIQEIKEGFDFARFETYCLASRERKVPEWYEKIGLTYDATLQGFGINGEAALLYSTVQKKGKIEMASVAELNALSKTQVN